MEKTNLKDLQDQNGLQDSLINDSPSWPASNEFPIIAFEPMPANYSQHYYPNDKVTIKALLRAVEDCGIDTVNVRGGMFAQTAHLSTAQEIAAQENAVKIKVIVNSDNLFENSKSCLEMVTALQNYDNLAAWNVKDEPSPNDWGEVLDKDGHVINPSGGQDVKYQIYNRDTIWHRLTVGYNLVRSLDPSRTVYFNLAATASPDVTGKYYYLYNSNYEQYAEYLRHLNRLYHPKAWSFDYYPVGCKLKSEDDNAEGLKPTDSQLDTVVWYNGLFTYLQCFQDITQATGSKFLAFANCMHYNLYDSKGRFNVKYPVPTIGKLRLEVFSAMCFGASGIVYYRYGLGPDTIKSQTNPINWNNAFVSLESAVSYKNQTIVKSPTIWPMVKSMNEQIRLWQRLFIGCSVGIHRHSFNGKEAGLPSAVNVGVEKLTDIDTQGTGIKRLVCLYNQETNNTDNGSANYGDDTGSYRTTAHRQPGVLLSWFTNPGYNDGHEHYIAILNMDIERPQQLFFVPEKGGYYFLKESKTVNVSTYSLSSTIPSPNTDHVITLTPGEMIVLFW